MNCRLFYATIWWPRLTAERCAQQTMCRVVPASRSTYLPFPDQSRDQTTEMTMYPRCFFDTCVKRNIEAILIFVAFSTLYCFNLSFLKPLYTGYDLFGMDSLPFLYTLYEYHPFPELHPLSKCLYYVFHWVTAAFPVPIDLTVRAGLAAIGGGNVALAFLILRSLLRDRRIAVLFAAAFGLFFSNLVFFSVPETYLVSDSIVLLYTFFLVRFHGGMTRRRFLMLSVLAGAGAANNLPLASLMVPHSYLLWRERKSLRQIVVPCIAGTAVTVAVFLGIDSAFQEHFFFARLFDYNRKWATVSHFADIGNWFRVFETFFLFSVVAPCKSLSSNVYNVASYFDRFGKFVLLAFYVYCLDRAWEHLAKKRDRIIDGMLLWALLMTLAYIYFGPGESFIYSSQVLLPVCLAFARTFESSRMKHKYSFAAIIIVLMGCNNLLCLYHPCEMQDLIPRQTVMGNAFVGARIRAARDTAGLTVRQLADAAGLDRDSLAAWEKGDKEISMFDLDKIARTLKKPLLYFCSPSPGR